MRIWRPGAQDPKSAVAYPVVVIIEVVVNAASRNDPCHMSVVQIPNETTAIATKSSKA